MNEYIFEVCFIDDSKYSFIVYAKNVGDVYIKAQNRLIQHSLLDKGIRYMAINKI